MKLPGGPWPDAALLSRHPTPGLIIGAFALILAIALSWADSLNASFQFDDWNVVVQDLRVRSVTDWWHSLPGIRASLKLSYALNHAVGSGPRGFRLFNLCVHISSALLLFALLHRRARALFAVRGPSSHSALQYLPWSEPALFVSFGAAAVFALEPVQTEAVTYICGRSSSLAAFCCLLTLCCWELAQQHRKSAWVLHTAGIAFYVIALTVKETAAVLPLALWLWHGTFPRHQLSSGPATTSSWHRCERIALVLYIVAGALAVCAALLLPAYRHLLDTSLHTRSMWANLAIQARAWGYLSLELLRLAEINADPQWPTSPDPYTPAAAVAAACWASAICLAWLARRRIPELAFSVLWYALWLLPTNSALPRLDILNDRQLYFALVGPAWLFALAVGYIGHTRVRVIGWMLMLVVVIVLGSATARRNLVYATEISFWQDALDRDPQNARAANNLGIAYALACRDDKAAHEFRLAIALDPNQFRARINLKLLQERALTRRTGSQCQLVSLTPPSSAAHSRFGQPPLQPRPTSG